MKQFVIAVIAFAASAFAGPALPSIDVFKNTLGPGARVIGGEDASKNQFPYQLSLRKGFLGSHLCGASLIAPGWGLTAAHCKTDARATYYVKAGMLSLIEINLDQQNVKVDNFITHPSYTSGVAPYDIGLLKLAEDVKLGDSAQLIALPSENECGDLSRKTVLSGWGLKNPGGILPSNTLQFIFLDLITNEQCDEKITSIVGDNPLDDTMICTGQTGNETQASCSGDSGGPLVQLGNQIGVVSWGITPCGVNGAPSVYTRVCSHRQWIDQTMAGS